MNTQNTKGVLGHPKYDLGKMVSFDITRGEKRYRVVGEVYIVDRFGTFDQNEEPSYDIMSVMDNGNECLYKHVRESLCTPCDETEMSIREYLIEAPEPEYVRSKDMSLREEVANALLKSNVSPEAFNWAWDALSTEIDRMTDTTTAYHYINRYDLDGKTLEVAIEFLRSQQELYPDGLLDFSTSDDELEINVMSKDPISHEGLVKIIMGKIYDKMHSIEYVRFLESQLKSFKSNV